ncbi:N-terminal phage integrase SAM-like domain-containing protein [Vreelandella azerica]|uniref:N-terminal phage integrase SAM-like domain-containing protein n=1 Tax=Vreelandella azerica TaxID=2732867 RepID=UPI001F24F8F9|nr:N-terminal phage integrase SAM-like domain-containing protein [Halomonas azerica]
MLDDLDYAEFFPNSKNLRKLGLDEESQKTAAQQLSDTPAQPLVDTPLFSEFALQWLEESKIQWRASHVRNVTSILDSSLLPAFGKSLSVRSKRQTLWPFAPSWQNEGDGAQMARCRPKPSTVTWLSCA